MIFVDTGVWYARFVPTDADHLRVVEWFRANREPLITSDYLMSELLTLMRARGEFVRALATGRVLLDQRMAVLIHVDEPTVAAAFDVFRRFTDKEWSFTDCVSYVVIGHSRVRTAASLERHFRQFGIVAVVP